MNIKKEHLFESYFFLLFLGVMIGYVLFSQSAQYQESAPSDMVRASSNIVAVSSSDNTGVLGKVEIEIHPNGRGRVLMNTNPFLEPDTQYSAETAALVAQAFTKKSLAERDVILSFNITGDLIGGPSAGAAITATMIAAIENRTVRDNVSVTGTIEPDGTIGTVGSVLEKARAAAEAGIKLFLVPQGQSVISYYEKVATEEVFAGFNIHRISYVPKSVDINNYTMQWGMETKEVSDISQLADYMLE